MTARHVRYIACRDVEHARRFMQAIMRHAPEAGLPLRVDGSLQDWQLYSIQANDGPVTVVIRQRREPGGTDAG